MCVEIGQIDRPNVAIAKTTSMTRVSGRWFSQLQHALSRRWAASIVLAFVLVAHAAVPAKAQTPDQIGGAGPAGEETAPLRRQLWRLPSADPSTPAQAVLFRPAGPGPFRLAVVAHASIENPIARARMPLMDYRALAATLVARGFAVVVPQRPGHGATGGSYLESQGGCADANYLRAGNATADSIAAALDFLRVQPFIRKDGALVIGHSAGGWGALALAARNSKAVARIVVFSPGRGGHADNVPGKVCAEEKLIATAAAFGRTARMPVIWLVARNDTYFSPALSRRMADAFRSGGARVDFRVLGASGDEGHWLAEQEGGERVWGNLVD
jgi:dienelactone hydrolase